MFDFGRCFGRSFYQSHDEQQHLRDQSEWIKADAASPHLQSTNGLSMSKYPTTTQRAEELQSLMAALSIIQIAGLDLGDKPPIMPLKYSHYLIAADAHLLIVPSTEATADHDIVGELMDFSRCDALLISIIRSTTEGNRVVVDIGIRDRLPIWYKRYRPCLLDRALHFVPDQDIDRPAFKLTKVGLIAAVEFDELDSA